MSPRRRGLAALLLVMASAVATAQSSHHPGDAVRVNDRTISYERFNSFYVEYRNASGVAIGARGDQLNRLLRLREEAMALMIDQELVRQAAERAGVEVESADVDAEVAALRAVFDSDQAFEMRLQTEGYSPEAYDEHVRRMLAAKAYLNRVRADVPAVDDRMLETYYRDNERRLTLPERVRVRHILLTWKPMGTRDDRAAVREQMQPILERARAGEDFAALAREFSEDKATRDAGGDTGLFRPGQMVARFEAAAFALKPGEISAPVETAYGVHIMRLEERIEKQLLPLDRVREALREHVQAEFAEKAVESEMVRLRDAADIQVLIPLGRRPAEQQG